MLDSVQSISEIIKKHHLTPETQNLKILINFALY